MTTSERVQPFSNGTDFDNWEMRNCDHCQRNRCDLLTALDRAAYDAGTIPGAIAARLKCGADGAPAADCPERES